MLTLGVKDHAMYAYDKSLFCLSFTWKFKFKSYDIYHKKSNKDSFLNKNAFYYENIFKLIHIDL